MLPELKTDSIKYLLIMYLALAMLFSALWVVDSRHLDEKLSMISSSDIAAHKMRLIADLMGAVRDRLRLTREMLSAEDVFDKDELQQEIAGLAGVFVVRLAELNELELTQQERSALLEYSKIPPEIMTRLDVVAELAFEETDAANVLAEKLIIGEIVPLQESLEDGFMGMMRTIQNEVSTNSQNSLLKYKKSQRYRVILGGLIFFASLAVFLWTINSMLKVERRLRDISLTDGLTGVANRRCFDQRMVHEWRRAQRSGAPLSVLMIDVDYFKDFNDHYGHQAGDLCLIQIAEVIKEAGSRVSDMAARYGGEEFALILPDTGREGADNIAHKLLNNIYQRNIPHVRPTVKDVVTVSIGLATQVPLLSSGWEMLLKDADSALYKAKELGRNRVVSGV